MPGILASLVINGGRTEHLSSVPERQNQGDTARRPLDGRLVRRIAVFERDATASEGAKGRCWGIATALRVEELR